jgi:hypothetical protein
VAGETVVNLKLDSGSVFEALQRQIGDWRLSDHEFRPDTDEIHVYHDSGGAGRVTLTVAFELERAQLEAVLRSSKPAG